MKIQKLQSNQQTFGTIVRISPNAARLIQLSGAGRKAIRDIKSLENNGRDDILSLSHKYRKGSGLEISASLLDKQDKELFLSFVQPHELIVEKTQNGKNKYVSIKRLYNEARKSLNAIVISKDGYNKFLPYIQ